MTSAKDLILEQAALNTQRQLAVVQWHKLTGTKFTNAQLKVNIFAHIIICPCQQISKLRQSILLPNHHIRTLGQDPLTSFYDALGNALASIFSASWSMSGDIV